MYIVHYTFSYPDKKADAGKIAETVYRTIDTDSLYEAKRRLIEHHDQRGEKIEGIPKFVEGI